jgi:hypothetical protein
MRCRMEILKLCLAHPESYKLVILSCDRVKLNFLSFFLFFAQHRNCTGTTRVSYFFLCSCLLTQTFIGLLRTMSNIKLSLILLQDAGEATL